MKIKLIFLAITLCAVINSIYGQDQEINNVDSVKEARKNEFLSPSSIYKNIAGNKISREKLTTDYDLYLINHRGGIDYFEGLEIAIGVRFNGQILSQISFRYFGGDGLDYEAKMVKSGFKLTKRSKISSLETDYSSLEAISLDGEIRIYKKGVVVCKVYDGTYIGFTFYK